MRKSRQCPILGQNFENTFLIKWQNSLQIISKKKLTKIRPYTSQFLLTCHLIIKFFSGSKLLYNGCLTLFSYVSYRKNYKFGENLTMFQQYLSWNKHLCHKICFQQEFMEHEFSLDINHYLRLSAIFSKQECWKIKHQRVVSPV